MYGIYKIILEVTTRDGKTKAKDLLRENIIPIEFYGNGVKNKSLQVPYKAFRIVYRAAGSNTIIEMVVDGKEKHNVLVHEITKRKLIATELITFQYGSTN